MKKPSMIANPAKLAQVVDAEPRWKATFISRIVILLCDFLAIILAAAVPTRQGYVLAWSYIPLGVSFIWCLANIIVRLRRPRPMHPGANVAMDLLIWMGFFVVLFFQWYWISFAFSPDTNYYSDYYDGMFIVPPRYEEWLRMQLVSTLFATFSLALHMVLFVWACMDTSKRNKAEIESRRVAIAEKLDEQASRRRASDFNDYQENNESKRFTAGIQISPGAHHSYSSIDMGSSSPRRSISPPDSPAPSSPAPAYLSGVTSMDSKPHIKDPDRPNRT